MMKYVYPVTPVCIVFDYSRTLAQKEFPVGLRSLLIREYGDDWICPYISRHLLSLNPLQARCRRYSRGE
ncbi:hypothetical protein, partial [Shigella sonnei]